ncbi:MAG TPA: hypothetical protein VFJ18_00845, partial [Pararhizobium sp.]|nr:hypothetical protein [Pararhizobium sp.]
MRNTRSGSGIGQGSVYHILATQCHRQDSAPFGEYHPLELLPLAASAHTPCLVEAAIAVCAGIGGMEQKVHLARACRMFDAVKPVDEGACARFHAESVERGLPKRRLDPFPEVGGDVDIVGL